MTCLEFDWFGPMHFYYYYYYYYTNIVRAQNVIIR